MKPVIEIWPFLFFFLIFFPKLSDLGSFFSSPSFVCVEIIPSGPKKSKNSPTKGRLGVLITHFHKNKLK